MAPRTSEQFEKMRQESREKILYAALELFAVDGYHSVSVSKIARHAGVSKGLMYNYFESKDDLLKGIIDLAMAEGESMMSGILDPDPAKMMENIIRATFRELKERSQLWKLLLGLSLQVGNFPFVQEITQRKADGYHQLGAGLLAQLGFKEPEKEARIMGALFDGIALQYLSVGELVDLDAMESYLIEKYCNHENA